MKKILIIEDDTKFLDLLKKALLGAGLYEIETAADGLEGLESLKRGKPDLVLLDLVMPRMDGLTFLKTMRKDPAVARVPVIVVSQFNDIAKIAEGTMLGIRGYLVKADMTMESIVKAAADVLKTPVGTFY